MDWKSYFTKFERLLEISECIEYLKSGERDNINTFNFNDQCLPLLEQKRETTRNCTS